MIITEKVRGLRRKNKQGILSCWQNTHAGYSQNSKLKKNVTGKTNVLFNMSGKEKYGINY